jgi:hypothetical protein
LPKVVGGERQTTARAPVDEFDAAVIAVVIELPLVAVTPPVCDPDPQRDLLASLQLPLLI